jgi:hypothetical protein
VNRQSLATRRQRQVDRRIRGIRDGANPPERLRRPEFNPAIRPSNSDGLNIGPNAMTWAELKLGGVLSRALSSSVTQFG